MLRFTQSNDAKSARKYYTEGLSREDYYAEGQEIAGRWGGEGARLLGLSGTVDRESFGALCENRHPETGERLTPRTKRNRRVGYDINFHAPKSVSVLYAHTGDRRILDAFREAVDEAMREMETEMKTRVRVGGKSEDRQTGNMTWATFVHLTARPVDGVPDVHLHAHAFTFNQTFDQIEGRWKAGQFGDLKRDAPYFEAGFHSRLARSLAEQGLGIRRTGKGWELDGVPQSVIEKFSRRTALIENTAERLGISYVEDKAGLGARTRERKKSLTTLTELRREWSARMSGTERRVLTEVARGRNWSAEPAMSARSAMDFALAHGFERESVRPAKLVCVDALRQGIGSVTVDAVRRELDRNDVIAREIDGRRLVTTKTVLDEERQMLDFARDGRGRLAPLKADTHDFEPIQGASGPWELNRGQKDAVSHVLQSTDRVIAIRGAAGTGKTALMREAVSTIEAEGKRVSVFAPSADASRGVLRKEGFREADTVARLLQDTDAQARVRGGVIWIDEAGLLGVREMHRMFEVARQQDARVILSGDWKQHAAVARGDAMRILETHAGVKPAVVSDIVRQRGAYKAAVEDLSKGEVERGFARLESLGAVAEIENDRRHERLAADYLQAVDEGRSALVIAPTHAEGERVTNLIRSSLRSSGRLSEEERTFTRLKSLHLTNAERQDAERYRGGFVVQFHKSAKGFRSGERATVTEVADGRVITEKASGERRELPLTHTDRFDVFEQSELRLAAGDRMRITRNGRTRAGRSHLNNGALYDVKGFTLEGDIELTNGWVVSRDYANFSYGFVTTSHASQGHTVDRVYIAQGAESFGAASREQFYVSVSRGRERVTVYTENRERLREAIKRSGERQAAVELVGQEDRQQNWLLAHAQRLHKAAVLARAYAGEKLRALGKKYDRFSERIVARTQLVRAEEHER